MISNWFGTGPSWLVADDGRHHVGPALLLIVRRKPLDRGSFPELLFIGVQPPAPEMVGELRFAIVSFNRKSFTADNL